MEGIDLTGCSTDRLEQELVALEAVGSRVRAEQMLLLEELDRRQVALGDGCKTLSEWVAGRVDVAPETASTLVRTMRRLQELPETSKRLQAGEMSYDRVVELARLAGEDETSIIDDVGRWDISGLRRQVAGRRRLTPGDEQRIQRDQHLVMQPNLDRSRWDIRGAVPGMAGAVIDRALQERADSLPTLPAERPGRAHRNALALTAICQDTLDWAVRAGGSSAPLATVFVDATLAGLSHGEAGVTVAAGPRVGPNTLQAILCTGKVEVIVDIAKGVPIAAGPAAHGIPPRLRRFVLARDGSCCADGCTATYRLQPHHRIHREHRGTDDPDNLVTLCWFHHHVVIHGYGYRINPNSPPGRIRFIRPTTSKDPP